MNSSFLYHVWGLYNHKCSREEYKGNTIILHVETKGRIKTGRYNLHYDLRGGDFSFIPYTSESPSSTHLIFGC